MAELIAKPPTKRGETIFLLSILIALTCVGMYGYHTHKPHTQNLSRVQTTDMVVSSPEFLVFYNQFWQKFGSTAAVTADLNHDSIVSQTEIDLFKNKFLSDMNLRLDPANNIFVFNEFNNVVNPERLTCYIQHYDAKLGPNQRADILKSC